MSSRYFIAGGFPSGNGGLFAYDGNGIRAIEQSDAAHIGDHVDVYHLTSIGKVLLVSERGLFELTANLAVRQIVVPPKFAFGLPMAEVVEMAASHAALIMGNTDVLRMGADGSIAHVPGAQYFENTAGRDVAGIIPVREELLLVGRRGLALVVDEAIAESGTCK